jgi:hypothetical protein
MATFATKTPKHLGPDEMNNYNEFYPFDPSYPYLLRNRERNNYVMQYFDPSDLTDDLDATKMTHTLPGIGQIKKTRQESRDKRDAGRGSRAIHEKFSEVTDILGLPEEVLEQLQSSASQRKKNRHAFETAITDADENHLKKRGLPLDDASIFNMDSFVASNRYTHKGREEFHDMFMTPEF